MDFAKTSKVFHSSLEEGWGLSLMKIWIFISLLSLTYGRTTQIVSTTSAHSTDNTTTTLSTVSVSTATSSVTPSFSTSSTATTMSTSVSSTVTPSILSTLTPSTPTTSQTSSATLCSGTLDCHASVTVNQTSTMVSSPVSTAVLLPSDCYGISAAIVTQTLTFNASIINVSSTIMVSSRLSSRVSVSTAPLLPSNCYHVCVCNSSEGNVTSSTVGSTTSISASSPLPNVGISSTTSANVSTRNYKSSVSLKPNSTAPVPRSTVPGPSETCWVEVECSINPQLITTTTSHDVMTTTSTQSTTTTTTLSTVSISSTSTSSVSPSSSTSSTVTASVLYISTYSTHSTAIMKSLSTVSVSPTSTSSVSPSSSTSSTITASSSFIHSVSLSSSTSSTITASVLSTYSTHSTATMTTVSTVSLSSTSTPSVRPSSVKSSIITASVLSTYSTHQTATMTTVSTVSVSSTFTSSDPQSSSTSSTITTSVVSTTATHSTATMTTLSASSVSPTSTSSVRPSSSTSSTVTASLLSTYSSHSTATMKSLSTALVSPTSTSSIRPSSVTSSTVAASVVSTSSTHSTATMRTVSTVSVSSTQFTSSDPQSSSTSSTVAASVVSTTATHSTATMTTLSTSSVSPTSTSSVPPSSSTSSTVTTSVLSTSSTQSTATTEPTTVSSTISTSTLSTSSASTPTTSQTSTATLCSDSLDCHESSVVATTSHDVATTHLQIVAASSVVSTAEALCPGRQGCSDSSSTSVVPQDLTASITPTTTLSSVASSTTQIVYAPAPQVTEVKFSETAATILIHFDVEVKFVSADETCYDFFTSQTAAMLGSDPECFLSHTQELQIILGVGANISVGDGLVFKDRVFKARLEEYSRFLSGSFSVQAPDPPLKPTPVITGPEVLSSCGNLSLSGSQSFGSGGRPLIFKWSLTSPNVGNDVTAITNVLSGLSSDADRVNIPGSLFMSNKTYVFKLKVSNFLNQSAFEEATHSVTKASDPVPALTLSSSIDLSEGEVFVSEELSIRATAIVAPCVSDTRVDFSWTVTSSDASAKEKVESSSSFQTTKIQAALKITKGVLTGGVNFTFTVTGNMRYDPRIQSSISQVIKALPSPLEPAIVGGDRQIGRDSGAITLDAKTMTVDPDGASHELSCSWNCEVQGGGSCNSTVDNDLIFAAVSGCVTEVQSNIFFAAKTYIISVEVSKGARSATASITLTVVEGNPPAVWVDVASLKIKTSERLTLEGYYKTRLQPTNVAWSCSQEQGFAFVDLSVYTPATAFNPGNDSFVLLTLPANLLKPGAKYRFNLKVSDGSGEGVASLVVEVRTGPTSGSLSVSPSSVQALDVAILSAPQWTTDPDSVPLRYAFGILVEKDVCETFGLPSNDPEREQVMPQGSAPSYILPLCVVVLDKFDSFAIETVNITSSPPDANDLTPDALESLLDNAVDDPLQSGNVDAALGAVMSIIDTVQQSNGTSDLKSNISQKTQEIVMEILGSTVIDQDIAFPLLTTLVKTDATVSDNSSKTANAAVTILHGLEDKPLPDELAGDFLKWIADLAEDSIENDDGLKETVGNALDKFADNIGAELKCGDPPREASDDRLGSVKVQVSTLEEEIASSSKSGAPRFDPGPELSEQYSAPRECGGGKICCGVFLKLIRYKENLIVADERKQNDDFQVMSSQILGVDLRDPITKTPLAVQSLSQPLKLSFTVTSVPDGKVLGCVYFDEQQKVWVKTGLKAVGPVGNRFTCESTHATYFASSHDSTSTAEKSSHDLTRGIVGIVMGFLMGIVALLLIFGFIWWRKHQKITTELPSFDHRF